MSTGQRQEPVTGFICDGHEPLDLGETLLSENVLPSLRIFVIYLTTLSVTEAM